MATTATAPRLTDPASTSTTVRKLSQVQPYPRVPSLPKLHGRSSLITTKLCETVSSHSTQLTQPHPQRYRFLDCAVGRRTEV